VVIVVAGFSHLDVYMKKIVYSFFMIVSLWCSAKPQVSVVYPREGQKISARSKTFIMGNISPSDSKLFINNTLVDVHSTGSFLAVLPVKEGEFAFECKVISRDNLTAQLTRNVTVTRWRPAAVTTENIIEPIELMPAYDIGVLLNEPVAFQCKTKPGKNVLCTVSDKSETIEFSLVDSKGKGVYQATHSFDKVLQDASITYRVGNDSRIKPVVSETVITVKNASSYPAYLVTAGTMEMKARDSASYNGNYTDFLTRGTILASTGYDGEWVRLLQSQDKAVYVRSDQVTKVQSDNLIAGGTFTDVIVNESPREIIVYIRGISQSNSSWLVKPGVKQLGLRLFNTSSNPDGEVLLTSNSSVVNVAKINTKYDCDLLMDLDFEPIWGFDINYENGYGIFTINKPLNEQLDRKIRVCVDPGHGGDETGAVGPSRLCEKEAVLALSKSVAAALVNAGYNVVVTRDSDVKVPIYDRATFAKRNDADVFISLHYNACPDGSDPYARRGLESYYYFNSGKVLADALHSKLKGAVAIKDNGVEHKSLVVCRNYQMPSCLLELDYISIPEAEELIMTPEFQQKVSEAIVAGLNIYTGRN